MAFTKSMAARAPALAGVLLLSACMTSSSRTGTDEDEPFAVLTAYFDN